ncbi:MAG: hypothetical protein RIS75_960 [Actinomycetota bacterium]
MSRQIFEYSQPDRFIVGTVGPPGERAFFLQAVAGRRVTTVAIEKGQARALAEGLDRLLDELRRNELPVPMVDPGDLDLEPLTAPIEPEFVAQSMGLMWNDSLDLLTLEVNAPSDDESAMHDVDDDSPDGPDCLRVRINLFQARAFVARTLRVVSAGRQPCPFCQLPLTPLGHVCPRANGYRR